MIYNIITTIKNYVLGISMFVRIIEILLFEAKLKRKMISISVLGIVMQFNVLEIELFRKK
jgi:hypothetical protein